MSDAVTFRRSPSALWRRVGDEVLIADAEGPDISSLSPPASAAWLHLERPRTREDLIDELVVRLGVPAKEIAAHIERSLGQLEERGWLIRTVGDG